MSNIKKAHEGATSAVSYGWIAGGSFFGSIVAGTFLGLGLDAWLNTRPWLVVAGIIIGSVSGFYRMWGLLDATGSQGKQDIFDGR